MARGFICSTACGILVLWPGFEPTYPAFQGNFLTTEPILVSNQGSNRRPLQWKSQRLCFFKYIHKVVQPSSQSILEHFHYCKKKPKAITPHFSLPWAPDNHQSNLCMCLFWILHINEIIKCGFCTITDFFHLAYCSFARFTHVITCINSFPFYDKIIFQCVENQSSTDGHLGCLHFSTFVNSAVMTFLFALAFVLLLLSGTVGSHGPLLSLLRNCFPKWLHHYTFLLNRMNFGVRPR